MSLSLCMYYIYNNCFTGKIKQIQFTIIMLDALEGNKNYGDNKLHCHKNNNKNCKT